MTSKPIVPTGQLETVIRQMPDAFTALDFLLTPFRTSSLTSGMSSSSGTVLMAPARATQRSPISATASAPMPGGRRQHCWNRRRKDGSRKRAAVFAAPPKRRAGDSAALGWLSTAGRKPMGRVTLHTIRQA